MSADARIQPASIPRSPKALKLREARFEDYPLLAALASKYHLYFESYPEWTHLWTDNPAYREIKDKVPMGWVLADGEGGISGYLGNIPLNYELEGKRLLAVSDPSVGGGYGLSTVLAAAFGNVFPTAQRGSVPEHDRKRRGRSCLQYFSRAFACPWAPGIGLCIGLPIAKASPRVSCAERAWRWPSR